MDTIFLVFSALFGLCLGSYATALSYRLPRGISMIKKSRSACPACDHDLGILDLVPFFSWLFLRGRCRYCKAAIGCRYPLIEMATAALCLGFYSAFGFGAVTLVLFLLAPVLVAMVDIDLHHKILPDSLNLAVFLLGLVVLALDPYADWMDAVGGVILYGLGSYLLRYAFMLVMKREPMGLGDVKFFAAAGLWLGLGAEKLAFFLLMSGVLGIFLGLLWRWRTKDPEFPFGPALIVSFIVILFSYSDKF